MVSYKKVTSNLLKLYITGFSGQLSGYINVNVHFIKLIPQVMNHKAGDTSLQNKKIKYDSIIFKPYLSGIDYL